MKNAWNNNLVFNVLMLKNIHSNAFKSKYLTKNYLHHALVSFALCNRNQNERKIGYPFPLNKTLKSNRSTRAFRPNATKLNTFVLNHNFEEIFSLSKTSWIIYLIGNSREFRYRIMNLIRCSAKKVSFDLLHCFFSFCEKPNHI